MALTRPFITGRFIAHEGDLYVRRLSLAVRVVDAFTGRPTETPLRVLLKEVPPDAPPPVVEDADADTDPRAPRKRFRRARPLRSLSGLICFEDMAAGEYRLLVEPDPVTADWYYLQPRLPTEPWPQGFERVITLPLPDPQAPLETVTLSPKPSYPFPANATLVRGTVTRGAPAVGVPRAVVATTYEQVDPDDKDLTVAVDVQTQTDRDGHYVLFFRKLSDKAQEVEITATKDGAVFPPRKVTITEGATLKAGPLHLP